MGHIWMVSTIINIGLNLQKPSLLLIKFFSKSTFQIALGHVLHRIGIFKLINWLQIEEVLCDVQNGVQSVLWPLEQLAEPGSHPYCCSLFQSETVAAALQETSLSYLLYFFHWKISSDMFFTNLILILGLEKIFKSVIYTFLCMFAGSFKSALYNSLWEFSVKFSFWFTL